MINILVTATLAGFAIYWENRKPFTYHYILKPLTTICILVMAFSYAAPIFSTYSILIMAGLVFSLFGDVFLMLPKDRFLPGLVSFLLAQIIYTYAFITAAVHYDWLIGVPFLLYGIWIFFNLKSKLGKMKLPVLIYLLFILTMVWSALNLWQDGENLRGRMVAFGAAIFVISDSILALNRFKTPIRLGRPIILGTYFLAQYLIASSLNY